MRSNEWSQRGMRILRLLVVLATVASSACQANSKGGQDGGAGSSGASSGGNLGSAGEAGGGSDASGTGAGGSHTGGSGGTDTGDTDTGGTDAGDTNAGGTAGADTGGGGADGGGVDTGGTSGGGTAGAGMGGGSGGTGGTDDNDGLPRALDFAGPLQAVAEAQGQELTFTPPDGSTTIDIIVLFSPPGTTAWTPVPASPGAADVTVVADEPGTYAPVIVDTSPPDGCIETVWGGSVSATSNSALAELEGYTHVFGNLTLEGTVDDLRPLRCLTEIRGALTISGSAIETARFPNLARIHGDLLVAQAEALTTIAAPNLRLAGALTLTQLSALRAVDFGGLAYGYGTELSHLGSSSDEPIELAFSWLVDIRGALAVTINAGLTSLDGFSALQSAANVLVFGNSLENANGLRKLESAQEILFEGGAQLTSIDLSALRQLERLELSSVPALTSVKVSALEEIETEIIVYDVGSHALGPLEVDLSSLRRVSRLALDHAVNLETLEGLSALEAVEEMEVLRADSLRTAALAALASIEQARFDDNPNLETIALPSLTTLGYSDEYYSGLELAALPKLTMLDMNSIEEIAGSMRVAELGAAAEAELTLAFEGLRTIRGTVWFNQVANLLDLDGFSQLHEVGVSIQFHRTDGLVDATGLANLETVGGCIIFQDSLHLTHISLVSLVEAGYGGCPTVGASDLPELRSLEVSSLEQTVGAISLRNLAELADGDLTVDFSSLSGATGLIVSGVDNLASVDAFSALTQLSGDLVIEDNPELVSLAGLDQLVTFGAYGFFTVTGNTALSECEPLELLDRLEAEGFHGTVSVSGNMADTCD